MTEQPNDAVAQAYQVINNADPDTETQLNRLKGLYEKVGEDPETADKAIQGIMSSGPGAAARLLATADAVAALHGIQE